MTSYYDYVLGVIPIALFGVGGGLSAAGVPRELGFMVGGLLAIALIGHAIFVNGPVQNRTTPRRSDRHTSTASDHPAPSRTERRRSTSASD